MSDAMQNTDVISAFLDNEEFDSRELAAALATSEGRDTLLQLIGLRQIVQPSAAETSGVVDSPGRGSRLWLRAAVLLLAIGAGYGVGTSVRGSRQASSLDRSTPPAPTIVVHQTSDGGWEPIKRGE
jgi:hypothetical protein